MEEQRQQRINEAAGQFSRAVVESYRAMGERGVSAQQLNAELARQFFNGVIESLNRTAKETRGASQDLTEQSRRAQEAYQALARESVGVYMEFLNSMFGLGLRAAERGTREAER